MGKDLIIEGEIIARNDVNPRLLLDAPMLQTQSLRLTQQLRLRDLPGPICLRSLLQVAVDSHAGKTEDRTVDLNQHRALFSSFDV